MPIPYSVKKGDYLAKIAKAHGHPDWRTIWNHPDNASLKAERGNPNVLYAGDVLMIPEIDTKQVPAAVDQRHSFQVARQPLKLALSLANLHRKPVAGASCKLIVDGREETITTDANGRFERPIAHDASVGSLQFDSGQAGVIDLTVPFRIGHLDPVTTAEGQCQRLNNLGYFAGPFDERDAAENAALLLSAIEEFQCDQALQVDGQCGPATQARLKQIHGC